MPSAADKRVKARNDDTFELYRRGDTPARMVLTIQLVLSARRWRAKVDERLRPLEQSSARMETLAVILSSPPLSPQVDIARRLRIEGPTLTRMLESLEKDGLVERLPDPADRRTKLLRLTKAGEETLEQMFAAADEMRGHLLDGFTDDEIDELNDYLGRVLERLDRKPADGE